MSEAAAVLRRAHRTRWPWLVLATFLGFAFVGSLLVVANGESYAGQVPFVIAFAMFGVVGALILSRAPGNRIGGLLLFGSTVTAASFVSGEAVTYLVERGSTGWPAPLFAVLSNLGWMVGIMPVILLIPQLFPDGHALSPRWVPVAWFTIGIVALLSLSLLLGEPTLTGSSDSAAVDNPLFVPALERVTPSDGALTALLLVALTGGVTSLIVRFRRARGVERQQIKWVALSLVFLIASFVVSDVATGLGISTLLVDVFVSGPAFLSIPVSIGVAVLQYRLFDLDVVVKKTVVAGTLFLLGVAVYGAVVWAFGAMASERASSVSVFLTALLLGVAFRPATRFARRQADRLVYGRRATPYEVLTEFSERVGDAYATEDVLGRMAQILGEGVGAEAARVWLHVGGELRPASTWPADSAEMAPVPVRGDVAPAVEGEVAVEVRDRGELLGALSVAMPTNDPMTPAKERLVRDLASQAGLALRNVRLVEELRASQRRIVAAQDAERRRLERNIHDGAQQQLVALAVKTRLARSMVAKDPPGSEAVLEQIESETQAALEDLRDLARGIYPPLLADKGLAAALEAQARKSPVPVEFSADGVSRYPQEVEAAVYFSVLEALQNVAKYAEARRVRVRLNDEGGALGFVVDDDGRGFDPDATGHGTGLQGIVDRLAALGGTVEVRSRQGEGTTVAGRIPAERRAAPPGQQA